MSAAVLNISCYDIKAGTVISLAYYDVRKSYKLRNICVQLCTLVINVYELENSLNKNTL